MTPTSVPETGKIVLEHEARSLLEDERMKGACQGARVEEPRWAGG